MSTADAADLINQAVTEATQLLDLLLKAASARDAKQRSELMAGSSRRGSRLAEALYAAEEAAASAAGVAG
jgi:hypothetical protein